MFGAFQEAVELVENKKRQEIQKQKRIEAKKAAGSSWREANRPSETYSVWLITASALFHSLTALSLTAVSMPSSLLMILITAEIRKKAQAAKPKKKKKKRSNTFGKMDAAMEKQFEDTEISFDDQLRMQLEARKAKLTYLQ